MSNIDRNARKESLMREAIEVYGADAQLRMAQEEAAEVIVEINHMLRGRSGWIDVIREVVDLQLMLEQVMYMARSYGIDDKFIQLTEDEALRSLEGKLKNG